MLSYYVSLRSEFVMSLPSIVCKRDSVLFTLLYLFVREIISYLHYCTLYLCVREIMSYLFAHSGVSSMLPILLYLCSIFSQIKKM